ncbi:MAG: TIGR02710 family CRISPR-associated CARF protein [Methanobrevibacter sp.]|uniref:TIGR02710 family CRISPR-associated CARF protein n=1 Tax=Methanobrevibacter sp. TaxID=66852 RepID=UPI002E76B4D2|nr:TIGR02710 family CRISPR-associated CARF protein [Methanobrevibacter sp.]MEE0934869.1 TIGR02710 family CRISPR-associated CARF protein [Methanobrevibacter sp.]
MKRKEVVLFMIVGTGINCSDEDGARLVAQKLYSTITKMYPSKVVFFASEQSKNTIPYIEELFAQDNDEFILDDDYQIVLIESIDNFNACFEVFESKIWEFDEDIMNDYQIIMDYTSGTKTMSAAMACCGMFYRKDLISVGGDRSHGEVSSGTEIINYQNLYQIYDRISIARARRYFNSNRFMQCIDILERIVDVRFDKESSINICKSYYSWDIMDFENAYEYLKKVDLSNFDLIEIMEKLKKNLKALGMMVNSKSPNLKNCYILASLINNSIRKAEEYKYDDAIARLYRSFELIAQIQLSKYNIKSSDVDISVLMEKNVSEEFIEYLKKTEEDGKIRIGLVADFLLLNELGDKLGKYFVQNESKIKNLTQKRNNSILAHGLESQTEEDFNQFLEVVSELAHKLDKDMSRFLNETTFAKFDLRFE